VAGPTIDQFLSHLTVQWSEIAFAQELKAREPDDYGTPTLRAVATFAVSESDDPADEQTLYLVKTAVF
jgi:hypothetical protein